MIAHNFHRGDEAVAATGNRLDEARIVRRIIERITHLIHCRVEAMIVVDECIHRPKLQAQLLAGHYIAGAPEKMQQDFKRLSLNARAEFAVLAQISRGSIQLVQAEAKNRFLVCQFLHCFDPGLRCHKYFKRCTSITL